MANKMLIDSTHPEETRVVVLRGNRVEEFDFESANRKQLRGNIYLAKVTRVEPSLQAAFIDYGGNRHGFLAFSEIHPDYYQIPVADRQALIADEERAHREAEEEVDRRASGGGRGRRPRRDAAHGRRDAVRTQPLEASETDAPAEAHDAEGSHESGETYGTESHETPTDVHDEAAPATEASATEPPATDLPHAPYADDVGESVEQAQFAETQPQPEPAAPEHHDAPAIAEAADETSAPETVATAEHDSPATESPDLAPNGGNHGEDTAGNITEVDDHAAHEENGEEEDVIESVGGADAMEEVQERTPRYRRQYKIQEVIKRRQIMLVQVVKEERGTKGAALTTYLSLAGRYSVLMPNTARGGGISRKITNALDRKKLKEIAQDLEVPEGMGVILRTAGAARTKTEVKRDFEYLLRLWETVRDLTLKSSAPKLVYEEGSLIKRSIRDLYNKDIEEILVAGEDGHREARDFMRMLMPSHAKNVKLYKDTQPVFTRYGIESQLDAMFTPTVQLRSGGYIVINQTEALVAIDVNSGRATREHHIEDTATKTNIEASEEIARQLRLRDLAGLIVIDFIDMDENRNNRTVERRLKEALKNDRARIQVGRISHFGLMEMSRQRIRSSVLESSTDKCPHCGGTGHVRSVSSVALHLLRMLEEMLLKGATHNLVVRTRAEVALYALNHKRAHLRDLESRFQISITISADDSVGAAQPFVIEKGEQVHSVEAARALVAQQPSAPVIEADEDEPEDLLDEEAAEEEVGEAEVEAESEGEVQTDAAATETDENGQRRRRRRRGRGRGRENGAPREGAEPAHAARAEHATEHTAAHEDDDEGAEQVGGPSEGRTANGEPRPGESPGDAERRRRRRGRRGGRRNRRERDGERPPGAPDSGYPPIEPELAYAAADLGGPPPSEVPVARETEHEAPSYERTHERTYEPRPVFTPEPQPVAEHRQAPQAPQAPAEPPAPPEPPRKRSTVREPAPMFSSGAMSDVHAPAPETRAEAPAPVPAPAPEPVAAAPEPAAPEAEAKPRRFGWWNRRG